ncbi:phospholipase A2 inhibitor-like [Photinus pyralis]|uniref:phospholipase A2 inhibitor-like n=1 Tax=Photinus pyralis TaxID=7054 RepID=UPI0012676227|nr:phospholipase A2 inhibitor-like [Photinus pyralis]
MIGKCLVLLSILQNISLQCSTPSFDNALVNVNEKYVNVTGCISPASLNYAGEITYLHLAEQNVPDLNRGAIRNVSSKFYLSLPRNGIEILREEAFLNLPGVADIDLNGNRIQWIVENSFRDLPSLVRVSLHSNEVSEISPRALCDLPKLEEVIFTNNRLETFNQAWFYRTPRLKVLKFQENFLRSVPKGCFFNLPSITQIHFGHNQIEFVDKDAFRGLRRLETLSLFDNRLKNFEVVFHTPSKLMDISLAWNNLTYISDQMLETLRPIDLVLTLTGNPWQCACFDKVMNWKMKNNKTLVFEWFHFREDGVVCIYPKTNSDQCIQRSDDDFQKEYWIPFKYCVMNC